MRAVIQRVTHASVTIEGNKRSEIGDGFLILLGIESADNQEAQAQVQPNYEETQVDPNKVMDFLAKNNYFMPVNVEAKPGVTETGNIDAESEERIAGYMERFEEIYAIIEQEFGAELSPSVMDLVMDKLMGMAA